MPETKAPAWGERGTSRAARVGQGGDRPPGPGGHPDDLPIRGRVPQPLGQRNARTSQSLCRSLRGLRLLTTRAELPAAPSGILLPRSLAMSDLPAVALPPNRAFS